MATYNAGDGNPSDFHLVHRGRFALGGAGPVMTEATAVTEQARSRPAASASGVISRSRRSAI